MKTDTNICPACGMPSPRDTCLCANCAAPLVLTSKGSVAVWRLGEVRPDVLDGIARMIGKSLGRYLHIFKSKLLLSMAYECPG